MKTVENIWNSMHPRSTAEEQFTACPICGASEPLSSLQARQSYIIPHFQKAFGRVVDCPLKGYTRGTLVYSLRASLSAAGPLTVTDEEGKAFSGAFEVPP